MSKYETLTDWYDRVYHNKQTPKEVTFQLTEACNLACTYCYQIAKTPRVMSFDVGKRIVDFLFELSEGTKGPITKDTPWIILDFIGGEPLLQTNLMSKICHYFLSEAIEKHHRWASHFSISIASNGTLYFEPEFQQFLKDFEGHISFSVSIDGDEEAHDKCRIFPDGRGSFKLAKAAQEDYDKKYSIVAKQTKATIARSNLPYIDKIIKYFASQGYTMIHANTVYEEKWNIDDAKLYYKKLNEIADFNLCLDNPIEISLFNEFFFKEKTDKKQTWCGGYKDMLAFDPEGFAYPCIRYMPSSLGHNIEPIVIGDCYSGLYKTDKQKYFYDALKNTTWSTQNSEECLKCSIAEGCSDCAAWSYQSMGKLGVRNINSCIMHKARSLANSRYWNLLYKKQNREERLPINLSKEEALKIIAEEEYNYLKKLSE